MRGRDLEVDESPAVTGSAVRVVRRRRRVHERNYVRTASCCVAYACITTPKLKSRTACSSQCVKVCRVTELSSGAARRHKLNYLTRTCRYSSPHQHPDTNLLLKFPQNRRCTQVQFTYYRQLCSVQGEFPSGPQLQTSTSAITSSVDVVEFRYEYE